MANSNGIVIIDHGWRHFADSMHELNNKVIDCGIQSGEASDLLDYVFFNEFGTKHIPARPALRTTLIKYKAELTAAAAAAVQNITRGAAVDQQLGIVGLFLESKTKINITSGNWKPNTAQTILIKGSSKPLIDKARYLSSIRYVIKDR